MKNRKKFMTKKIQWKKNGKIAEKMNENLKKNQLMEFFFKKNVIHMKKIIQKIILKIYKIKFHL